MKVGTACPAFFCSCDGDLKGLCHGDDFCVVARQKQLQTFGKVLEKRFEVKQTGHIGFVVNDEKELKILNRTIKIDALNDETTLEADTKLVENALESMKLNGPKGVDPPRVRRSEEQNSTDREFREAHIDGVDFVSQFGDEVGVCCSRQS